MPRRHPTPAITSYTLPDTEGTYDNGLALRRGPRGEQAPWSSVKTLYPNRWPGPWGRFQESGRMQGKILLVWMVAAAGYKPVVEMVATPVSRASIRNTGIALIVIATITVGLRLYFGIIHHKQFRIEDGWLASCYVFFLVIAILYLYIVPAFFRLTDLGEGLIEPYATANDDALFIQKGLFVVSASLWFCLWSAKFSLLWMYKKLLVKLPFYMKLWYGLVGFCVLTLIGSLITLFLACSSMEAWFAVGKCTTPRDVVAAAVSMWFAYAVDVLTDLLIMLLPLRLILTLQMPLSRKLSIAALFCLGWVCIIASTVRVTQLGQPGGQPTVPWLALWGTIEAAIVTGPGLYRSAKLYSRSRKEYYAETSRTKTSHSRSRGLTTDGGGAELQPYPHTSVTAHPPSSSQEGLVHTERYDIVVTKEVSINNSLEEGREFAQRKKD